ncbi:MAG: DUF2760 domain-containing protein [Planctomycetota bacterium]|nr:DUF2760 domain-containing protein [Planctomycetota bacterium]
MGRIVLAFRSFFQSLFNADAARRIAAALAGDAPVAVEEQPQPITPQPTKPVAPPKPKRSDAVTLLATLQREARFIDFIKEPLDGFSDEQVGAVVRDLHRDCGAVLERVFQLRPAVDDIEGATIDTSGNLDPGLYRLTGNVSSHAGGSGTLQHHGWKVNKFDVPIWNGSESAVMVVAEAEVEVGA